MLFGFILEKHSLLGARPGDSTVDSGLGSYSATSPKPHRYFEAEPSPGEQEWQQKVNAPPPLPKSPPPDDQSAAFEMTRSAEVKLYHDEDGSLRPATIKTQDLISYNTPPGSVSVPEHGYDYRVTSESTSPYPKQIGGRRVEISPRPMGDLPHDYAEPPTDQLHKTSELHTVPLDNAILQRPVYMEQR